MDVFILVDRSGSMAEGGRWTEVLTAINGYVGEQLRTKAVTANARVTVALFDSPGESVAFEVLRHRQPAARWQPLSEQQAGPRGLTPLFDAIIKLVGLAEIAQPERATLVITTDGLENASRVATRDDARSALDRCRARGWQVVFLGVDFDAFAQSADLGGTAYQTLNATGGQLRGAFRSVARATESYASTGAIMSFGPADRPDTGREAGVTFESTTVESHVTGAPRRG